jgi:transcriptional regulator with XRE-family HTH domain
VTPGQCRAARALADISQAQLAGIAVVPRAIIEEFEAGVATPSEDDLAAMRRALEWADVEFTNGEGPGVRLRDPGGTAAADRFNASNDE